MYDDRDDNNDTDDDYDDNDDVAAFSLTMIIYHELYTIYVHALLLLLFLSLS